MTNPFTPVDPMDLNENSIKLIGKDWMLITGGGLDAYNQMTASWGFLGFLWQKPMAICMVRPQRHTLPFLQQHESFSLTFFEEANRKVLNYCGRYSGRDIDKMKVPGLTPFALPSGAVSFREARLILECKKCYTGKIDPKGFALAELSKTFYPGNDFHHLFFGEITGAWEKEK